MRDLLDSIDLCFLQEHWLIPDQLHNLTVSIVIFFLLV